MPLPALLLVHVYSFLLNHRGLARHSLTVILIFAFAIMTFLTVQQQRVIEAQQTLIHTLASDSFAYWHVIAKRVREHPRKITAPK